MNNLTPSSEIVIGDLFKVSRISNHKLTLKIRSGCNVTKKH